MTRAAAIRALFVVLAVVFFVTPIAARVLGVTAESFENRKLAQPPSLSQGWDAFPQTTRYVVDHMPLRAQATRTNTRIWRDVFSTDPRYVTKTAISDDQALPFAGAVKESDSGKQAKDHPSLLGTATASTGRDDWLFNAGEFEYACDDSPPDDLILERWSQLVRAVRASGRESAMFVVPYKGSIYPEHLPDKYPYDHCAPAGKERFWRLMSKEGPSAGVFGLRERLLRLKARTGDALYPHTDSHWTTLGALVMVDAVLKEFGGKVQLGSEEIVERGTVSDPGDLSVATGDAKSDRRDDYGIRRTPGAPRVPGRTLLLCDSYVYTWIRLFKPYFKHLSYTALYHPANRIMAAIRKSDRVIIEANELLMESAAADGDRAATLAQLLDADAQAN